MSISKRLLAEQQAKKLGLPSKYTPVELNQMIADWEELSMVINAAAVDNSAPNFKTPTKPQS
jgi:hypothetical protein